MGVPRRKRDCWLWLLLRWRREEVQWILADDRARWVLAERAHRWEIPEEFHQRVLFFLHGEIIDGLNPFAESDLAAVEQHGEMAQERLAFGIGQQATPGELAEELDEAAVELRSESPGTLLEGGRTTQFAGLQGERCEV